MNIFKKKSLNETATRRRASIRDSYTVDVNSFRSGSTLSSTLKSPSIETDRQKLRRLRTARRRLLYVLLTLGFILIVIIFLLIQLTGRISTVNTGKGVELSGNDATYYQKIVDEYLSKHSPERFSFIRRQSALAQFLMSKAPEVKSVSLTSSGLASSSLNLTFRQPVAMWLNKNHTSYVDKAGAVFSKNYYGEPKVAIKDDSGINVGGGVAASSKFLSFVGRTSSEIINRGFKIDRVVIPKGSIRYVEFYLSGYQFPFKAQITRDGRSQASDISIMARYIKDRNIKPQYVDCRIEGKAYWL